MLWREKKRAVSSSAIRERNHPLVASATDPVVERERRRESVIRRRRLVRFAGTHRVEAVVWLAGAQLGKFLGSTELRVDLAGIFEFGASELHGDFVIETGIHSFEKDLDFKRLAEPFEVCNSLRPIRYTK